MNENKPITCVNWYQAFAFCAWDGGRLPTEAEWNYAAAGADENRSYPWGEAAPTRELANYFDTVGVDPAASNVGVLTRGNARFGHADMGGNSWEWSLDWYADPFPTTDCNDCANLVAGTDRVIRGGSFGDQDFTLANAQRFKMTPNKMVDTIGIRCARDL
jgi:formylglycine-generating enzyme required for sulfatase activity